MAPPQSCAAAWWLGLAGLAAQLGGGGVLGQSQSQSQNCVIHAAADVAFIIDSSRSIGTGNYVDAVRFVFDVVDRLPLGVDAVRYPPPCSSPPTTPTHLFAPNCLPKTIVLSPSLLVGRGHLSATTALTTLAPLPVVWSCRVGHISYGGINGSAEVRVDFPFTSDAVQERISPLNLGLMVG